jgi:ParB family chromosome partitioning protein
MALASYDDIFQADAMPTPTGREQVLKIPMGELHPFENYPFKVWEDAAMRENVENVKDGAAIRPCVVRPRKAGGYEVIAGQRDIRACELAGMPAMPAIILEADDDTATIMMVNANLPQEKILPSEMAWALRMKMEALCHRGSKVEGIDPGTLSVEILIAQTGKGKNQIYRFCHLTELVPGLLDMVDESKIGFSIAADYLYKLSRQEQSWLLDSMGKHEATPSAAQALRLKKHSEGGTLTSEVMDGILSEEKKEPIKVTLAGSRLYQYFPPNYTPMQMEAVIMELLESWRLKSGVTAE